MVEGELGPAAGLIELARSAGITVGTTDGEGVIRVGGTRLALTDGRTATERAADGKGDLVLFDLALDYASAPRVAIAAADQADPAAVEHAAGFFQALGKQVSVVDDAPGLVVMRTVAMLVNEAADAVHQGIGTMEDVDLAMVKGVNYPRGPLAWADTIGLPRILQVIDQLARSLRGGPLPRLAAPAPPCPDGPSFHPSIGGPAMTGEAFICDAVRTPIGRYAGASLALTVARELELRRAKHALSAPCASGWGKASRPRSSV